MLCPVWDLMENPGFRNIYQFEIISGDPAVGVLRIASHFGKSHHLPSSSFRLGVTNWDSSKQQKHGNDCPNTYE